MAAWHWLACGARPFYFYYYDPIKRPPATPVTSSNCHSRGRWPGSYLEGSAAIAIGSRVRRQCSGVSYLSLAAGEAEYFLSGCGSLGGLDFLSALANLNCSGE